MKKLILAILFIVGSVYAQKDYLILKNGDKHWIRYVETLDDGTVRVQIFNNDSILATSFAVEEIYSIKLEDGEYVITPPIQEDVNPYKKLVSSGSQLVEFKNEFYKGRFISVIGSLITTISLLNVDYTDNKDFGKYQLPLGIGCVGLFVSVYGNIILYNSFKKIGEAGEDLIDVGEKLEADKDSN